MLRKGDDWFAENIGTFCGVPAQSAIVSSILLVIALFFPISYGIYDFFRRKKWNFLSILGTVSALMTGGIGLIPGGSVKMFAVKEAALPGLLSALTLATLRTNRPLVKLFLYNPDIFQIEKIEHLLLVNGTQNEFQRLLVKCTWLLAGTFFFSAVLNYFLSRMVVVTEPFVDKNAFNDEIGEMMAWSLPVISLPCMLASFYAIWIMVRGIKTFTGLEFEDAVRQSKRKPVKIV